MGELTDRSVFSKMSHSTDQYEARGGIEEKNEAARPRDYIILIGAKKFDEKFPLKIVRKIETWHRRLLKQKRNE